ncbi:hypothetical protein [Bacteroides cutis]|uniref:hypothetical protein n=1 Tax=Bacteroides cutis TaxID=2024197 RepID=UPI00278BFAC6|nr:hypothetical protein [Bacteroides cutis]
MVQRYAAQVSSSQSGWSTGASGKEVKSPDLVSTSNQEAVRIMVDIRMSTGIHIQ